MVGDVMSGSIQPLVSCEIPTQAGIFLGNDSNGTLILLERMLLVEDTNGYVLSRTCYEGGHVVMRHKHTFRSYRDFAFAVMPFSNVPLSEDDTLTGVLLLYEHPSVRQEGLSQQDDISAVTSLLFGSELSQLNTQRIITFNSGYRVADIDMSIKKMRATSTPVIHIQIDYGKETKEKKRIELTRSFPLLQRLTSGVDEIVDESSEKDYTYLDLTGKF